MGPAAIEVLALLLLGDGAAGVPVVFDRVAGEGAGPSSTLYGLERAGEAFS